MKSSSRVIGASKRVPQRAASAIAFWSTSNRSGRGSIADCFTRPPEFRFTQASRSFLPVADERSVTSTPAP